MYWYYVYICYVPFFYNTKGFGHTVLLLIGAVNKEHADVPFDTTALTPDRNGDPDSGPRTPWSPVRVIRVRVARPLVDLEEPDELAVSGTQEQVATKLLTNSASYVHWDGK